MSREVDYYVLLGVARDASEAEIRERFRTLAREAHPDRAPAARKAEAESKFQDLTEAVNVLTSPGAADAPTTSIWPPPGARPRSAETRSRRTT